MIDPETFELLKHGGTLAMILWAELRARPLLKKLLARAEESSANTARLCEHFGLKPMTDEEGEKLAERDDSPSAVAIAAGARLVLDEIKRDPTKKGA